MDKTGKVKILGIYVNNITQSEVLQKTEEFVGSSKPHILSFVNPEIIMRAQMLPSYKEYLNNADLVAPDGIGLLLASKIIGTPLKERVTGTNIMYSLAEMSAKKGFRLYFLGAKFDVVKTAVKKLTCLYPTLKVVGMNHGYFSVSEEKNVIAEIKTKKPDILIVCLGMYKQEMWIKRNLAEINVPVCFGNGGAFDFVSGRVKRAPLWMQKSGLEWFYRLLQEPRRIKRQLVLPLFLILVISRKFRRTIRKRQKLGLQ